MSTQSIAVAFFTEALVYDPDNGVFTWKIQSGKARIGDIAGSPTKAGYIAIGIGRKKYLAHRIAWLLTSGNWPTDHIDHINGNRTDNRIANLRPATQAQNNLNRPKQTRSKSGSKGVWFVSNRWRAGIRMNGKVEYLGRFGNKADAVAAYNARASELFGEFNRVECKQ